MFYLDMQHTITFHHMVIIFAKFQQIEIYVCMKWNVSFA